MKKLFILTGEPSGDKLASKVISQLKTSRSDIEYLSVGGEHLQALGIRSLYELNEITYLGFTKVFLYLFKIQKKINLTANKISGLNLIIPSTVSLIFFFILKIFNKTLVKPR